MATFKTEIRKNSGKVETRQFKNVSDTSFYLKNITDEMSKDSYVRVEFAGDVWVKPNMQTRGVLTSLSNGVPVEHFSEFEPGEALNLGQEFLSALYPKGAEVVLELGNPTDMNYWPTIKGEVVYVSEHRLIYIIVKPFAKGSGRIQKYPEPENFSNAPYLAEATDMSWEESRREPALYSTRMCKVEDVGRLMSHLPMKVRRGL